MLDTFTTPQIKTRLAFIRTGWTERNHMVAKVSDRIYKRNISPIVSYSLFKPMQEL